MPVNTKTRYPLRAIQRAMTMSDTACFKIVHIMRVQGQIHDMVPYLPAAVMLTFNKHPMMRLLQLQDAFAMAEVQPPIELDDVTTRDLLAVTEVDEAKDGVWPAYVQHEVHTGFDRYTQFPFYLRVWVDSTGHTARLFLFSDHQTSDARSGNTILNDVLTFAAELSRASIDPTPPEPIREQLPVLPSLYDLILNSQKALIGPAIRFVVKYGAPLLMKIQPQFTPVITPRSDQVDFKVPNPPDNQSTLLFANGTDENLAKIVARCREEGTTFFAALAAAITLSFMITTNSIDDEVFKLFVFANFDMRSRVTPPVDPQSVGCFINADLLPGFSTTVIDATTKRFWDLARQAKQEVDGLTQNMPMLAIPQVFMDQKFHTQTDPAFFEAFPIKYTQRSDVNVSSAGRYPYTLTHTTRTGEVSVDTVHYNGHFPFLSMSSLFFVTSVHQVTYGISHHYDEAVGKKLFDTAVHILEHSWRIEANDTLAETFNRLFKDANTTSNQAPSA